MKLIMKTVIKIYMRNLFLILSLLYMVFIHGQTIKPLSSFYTEAKPTNPSNAVYYKDIDNLFQPFLGTWIYQNGNTTFVVTLWKETKAPAKNEYGVPLYYKDRISGHYKLVQNYGTINQVVLYTSEINYLNSPTPISTVIYANCLQTGILSGGIYDINTMVNHPNYYFGKRGSLVMTIGANGNFNTAHWLITPDFEENWSDYPTPNFVIPVDITLTKQ